MSRQNPPNTTLKVTVINYEDGFLFLNITKKVKPSTTDTGSMEWPYFFFKVGDFSHPVGDGGTFFSIKTYIQTCK